MTYLKSTDLSTITGITGTSKMENFLSGVKHFHFEDSKIENIDKDVIMVTNGLNKTIFTDRELQDVTMFINNEYEKILSIKA